MLVACVIRQAMGYAGADFCLSSHGLTFMAQFKKKGSGGDPVTATADSEVLATARAALKYLGIALAGPEGLKPQLEGGL